MTGIKMDRTTTPYEMATSDIDPLAFPREGFWDAVNDDDLLDADFDN